MAGAPAGTAPSGDAEAPLPPRHGLERLASRGYAQGYAPLPSRAARERPCARGVAAVAAASVGAAAAAAVACARAGARRPPVERGASEELLALQAKNVSHSDTCAKLGRDCTQSGCCAEPRASCYEKHPLWAVCLLTCDPGIHPDDPLAGRTPWSCIEHAKPAKVVEENTTTAAEEHDQHSEGVPTPSPSPAEKLRCSHFFENCGASMCCTDPRARCFEKHEGFAACRPSCERGIHAEEVEEERTPWTCRELSRDPVASARSEPHIPAAPSLPTTPPPETTSRASAETRTSLPASRSCCFGPPGPSAHQQWHDDISDSLPGGAPLVSDVEACQALCCRHACRSLDARPEDGAVRCRLASSVAGSLEGGPLVDAVDGSGYQEMAECAPEGENRTHQSNSGVPGPTANSTVDGGEVKQKEEKTEGTISTPACSELFAECTESGCCSDRDAACFEKDEGFAQCRRTCETSGSNDDHEHAVVKDQARTPWTCNVRHASMEARARNRTSEEATTTTFDRQDDGAPERRIDFYCVALVMAGSYEVALMENAVAKGASVFQCSGYDVFSGESLHLGVHAISGKEVVANVVEGPLEVEKGGAYGTALNSEVFARVWKLIFEDGLFAQHDWTVKVDPDCVFLASRLEHHLQHERLRAEDSLYLNNCKDGLHGPLEVVSRGGMQAFGDGLDSCVEDLRFEWSTYGEDVFLRHCLGLRSVTRVDLFELLDETFDGTPPSCDSQAVAFHPLKSTESYSACLATSSPLEEAA